MKTLHHYRYAGGIAFAVLALVACGRSAPPVAEPPPVVKMITIGAAAAADNREYGGEIRARYEVPAAFRVGGKMIERTVDTGSRVGAGQLLARLDPTDLALQVGQARAQYELARADAQRYRELRRQNFVSAAALDAKETALVAAAAQMELASNQNAYARLQADRAGVVAAVLAEPGQVVAAGQPVVRLALDGPREVAISLPEAMYESAAPGNEVDVSLWSDDKVYRGRVRERSPLADAASRTFAVRITLPEAEESLPLGLSATVRFAGHGPGLRIVPLTAVFQQGSRPALWVVGQDNMVTLRPVTISAFTDAGAAVSEGIADGERIVGAGVNKLVEGQKVRPIP